MHALRRGGALAAALALGASCCCGVAAAQRPGAPAMRGVLVNDLPEVEEELRGVPEDVPESTPAEQFRQRLEKELNFVGRACQVTPEEREALDKAGDEIVERFKPLLEKQPPAAQGRLGRVQRMVAVNGQVIVLNAQGVVQTMIPDRLLHAQVDIAVQGSLSAKRLAMLDAERQRLEQKARQADALGLLAAVDEAMLLSGEQLKRLAAYLDANWRAVWGQVVSGSALTAPGATPLQTAKARGLGGVFDLFDADLEAILHPAQMAAWREMRTLRIDGQARDVAAMQAILLRRAAAGRIVRNANGQNVFVRDGRPAAAVQVPIQGGLRVNRRPGVAGSAANDSANLPEFMPARELTLLLNLLVEDAALAAGLTDEQRETLLLAGKLDLRRYGAEREDLWQETLRRAGAAPGQQHIAVRSETAAASNPFAEATSRFRKALASRLSEEQLARLAEVERKRRELRREAAIESVVREFDEVARLTSKQWDSLAEALRRRLPPLSGAPGPDDSQSETLSCMSALGKGDLQPLVDEDQWPAVEQKLIELKRTAARL